MKKWCIILAVVLLISTMLVGCTTPTDEVTDKDLTDTTDSVPTEMETPDAGSNTPVLKIGYLCQTQDYEFHKNALAGMISACDEAGTDLLYQVVGTDASAIRTAFDSFVTQGCNVIVNFSCAVEASQQIAELCEEKGIFHICVDTDVVSSGATTYFFGLNNATAGTLMGEGSFEWLSANVDGKVDHVISINASALGDAVMARTENAVAYLLSQDTDITEDNVYRLDITDYDLASIKQKVQDYLTLCGDYQNIVIYCLSSSWSPSVISAVEAAGLNEKVYYFSVDGVSETIKTLKEAAAGKETVLKGEVATYPEYYGQSLLRIAQDLVAGNELERYQYSENGWMTADNINELYPDA